MNGDIILQVPLPGTRSARHLNEVKVIGTLALRIQASSVSSLKGDMLWHIGWRLMQVIYTHGIGHMWEGMLAFVFVPEKFRGDSLPGNSTSKALREFRTSIMKEVRYDDEVH